MTDAIENPAGYRLEEPNYLNVGVPAPIQSRTKGAAWSKYHDGHRQALQALLGELGWALVPEMSRLANNDGRGAVYMFRSFDPRWRPGQYPNALKAYLRDNFVDVANAVELAVAKAKKLVPEGGNGAMVAVRPILGLVGDIAQAVDKVQYLPGEEFWKFGDAD